MRDYKLKAFENNDYKINTEKESYYALLVAIFNEDVTDADEAFLKLTSNREGSCKKGDKRYLDEDLIDIILSKADELGRSPKFSEIKQAKTIQNRFGSWNKALELSGLEIIKQKQNKHSDDELIDILKDKAKELGRTPKISEVKQGNIIKVRFGLWNNALKLAGIPTGMEFKYRNIHQELIGLLVKKYDELGRLPKAREFKQYRTVKNKFNSWEDAKVLATEIINKRQ